mgnify:CR=1 FL=1
MRVWVDRVLNTCRCAQDKELARQREAAAQSTAAASPAAARASRSSIGTSPMAVPSAHGNTACGTPVAELRRSRNESVARIEELEAKIASLQAANVRSPRVRSVPPPQRS